MQIGIISDTHGLLRPSVVELLQGSDLVLHAGDVGSEQILDELALVAPVTAVCGNTDHGPLRALPPTVEGELEGLPFRMVHRHEDIPAIWRREARLIVYGHSHRPEIEWYGNCVLLNPGACGHARFNLPLTVARVTVEGQRLTPEILSLSHSDEISGSKQGI